MRCRTTRSDSPTSRDSSLPSYTRQRRWTPPASRRLRSIRPTTPRPRLRPAIAGRPRASVDRDPALAIQDRQPPDVPSAGRSLGPSAATATDCRREPNLPYNSKSAGTSFTRACSALKIEDLCFHNLRHEATSRLFEQGCDIPEVAAVALPSSWNELKRYCDQNPCISRSLATKERRVTKPFAANNLRSRGTDFHLYQC
ncbi:putative DNA recombinase [Stenotrophomonas maltophilia K279a]|uniref:DNA recombinase n=1 Tax=Stenotrophomonas maltophilia (strain K279a) TaxID=522373 RepID=B2FJ03_STRMK|nr:putative DNA recombinase [Stenotrophomonas maltophilia K279a]